MKHTLTCAPRPCASCPYRQDVPSGIWAENEYVKLPSYDGDIIDQMMQGATTPFACHQRDGKLCAGWVACHGPENLLALRLKGEAVPAETWTYQTDVAVFRSGAEAAHHGVRDLDDPGVKAQKLMAKLVAKGKGVTSRKGRKK